MSGQFLTTPGAPQMKGYIPQLYAAKMLKHYYERSIAAALFNTDYEGMFSKMGETIHIRKPATVLARKWKDGDKVIYPDVGADEVEMHIDHGCIWSFKVPLKLTKQTDLKSFENQWMEDAVKNAQAYVETTCISKILGSNLDPVNIGNTAGRDSGIYKLGTLENPVVISAKETSDTVQNATDYVADILSVLDEQNVTNDGMAVNFVAPKVFRNRIAKSDFKYADKLGTPSTTLRIGAESIGQVFGANFFDTGYLRPVKNPSGKTVFPVIACTKAAASFAMQFTDDWSDVLEGEVAKGYRGLSVYGCELIEPKAIAVGYVTFAAA